MTTKKKAASKNPSRKTRIQEALSPLVSGKGSVLSVSRIDAVIAHLATMLKVTWPVQEWQGNREKERAGKAAGRRAAHEYFNANRKAFLENIEVSPDWSSELIFRPKLELREQLDKVYGEAYAKAAAAVDPFAAERPVLDKLEDLRLALLTSNTQTLSGIVNFFSDELSKK